MQKPWYTICMIQYILYNIAWSALYYVLYFVNWATLVLCMRHSLYADQASLG